MPERLEELIKARDFGPYANDRGDLVVCFIHGTDITGGNSGSPVMNANGDLIGLAFDGNWEAMSGDIAFEPRLQRTISVDIRYVMWILDKYADAPTSSRKWTSSTPQKTWKIPLLRSPNQRPCQRQVTSIACMKKPGPWFGLFCVWDVQVRPRCGWRSRCRTWFG